MLYWVIVDDAICIFNVVYYRCYYALFFCSRFAGPANSQSLSRLQIQNIIISLSSFRNDVSNDDVDLRLAHAQPAHANIASATQIFGTLAGLRLSTLPTNVGRLSELRHSRQTVVCLGALDNSIFCRVRLPTAVLSDSINDVS